jgi:probable HAF family extracellular repeat protein
LTSSGYTAANGINNAGQVVGDYETMYGSDNHGFLYQNGVFTTIDDPDAGPQGTSAQGINDNGVIVGFFTDASNKQHGFIDNDGVFTTIDNPLGVNGTSLNGINDAGEVVGYYTDANNVTHGFVANPTVTITVLTSNGLDFHASGPLGQMGRGAIQSGGSLTSFTIVDSADHVEFVLDGNNFTYGSSNSGITLAGGTLTSFHEFTDTGTALADFTGLLVDAVTWLADAKLAAGGNTGPLDALTSTFAYHFSGGSGSETFGSAGHADTLSGTGADVFDGGGAPTGSHDTLTGGAGSTFVFQQGYGALTITNFDQANGTFVATDHIQLNGFTGALTPTFVPDGGTFDTVLTSGGDVVTLLHVTEAEFTALDGSEFASGGTGNNNGPILNSFALTVSESSSTVLTTADFDVTHSQSSDFFSMPLNSVTGGEFEVTQDGGETWPSAPTGGFTIAQIEAGEVRFTPDSSAIVPDFPITVSDGVGNVSPAIAPMVSLEIAGANAEIITFAGSSGTLQLDNPSSFTGEIAGINGSGDVLDIHGLAAATTTAVTGSGSYDSDSNITTLTVTDSSSQSQPETFKLVGDYSTSHWTVTDDHNGGVDIVDPPGTPAVAATTPAPAATSTIVATAPNQILTGNAASDTFAFNFTGVGHTTVTDFHPATDTLQFSGPLFANPQAALNATHDDGHGNTVIALDAHDTIILNGILKAQLHASDFHFV